jgi:DNA invertase Pin-like site-specific DNA recombinase
MICEGLSWTSQGRGVHVRFVKENLTFTGQDGPMSNLLLSLLGAVAEFERSMIRERQREGIQHVGRMAL